MGGGGGKSRGRGEGAAREGAAGSAAGPAPREAPRLGPGDLVLVDSAPLVYLVEGGPGSRRRAAVEAAMAAISGAGARLAASTLVWAELLTDPLRRGDEATAAAYRALLSDSSRIVLEPVDAAIAEGAARLRATRGLGLADAVHLATAAVLRAAAVLGNDGAWRGIPECPPLLLVDELAFEAGPGETPAGSPDGRPNPG